MANVCAEHRLYAAGCVAGVFGLKPWLMFAGVVLGFVGAYLLVNKQLGRVKRKKERKNI